MYPHEKMKDVFTIRPGREGDKGRWVRIGIGFVNGRRVLSSAANTLSAVLSLILYALNGTLSWRLTVPSTAPVRVRQMTACAMRNLGECS